MTISLFRKPFELAADIMTLFGYSNAECCAWEGLPTFQMPYGLAVRHPDWQKMVQDNCPATLAAFGYAAEQNIRFKVQYSFYDRWNGIGGRTFFDSEDIDLYVRRRQDIADVLGAADHEIKHKKQIHSCLNLNGWIKLENDLKLTRISGQYQMAKSYCLPNIPHMIFLKAGMEFDAYFYEVIAQCELKTAFLNKPNEWWDQQKIDLISSYLVRDNRWTLALRDGEKDRIKSLERDVERLAALQNQYHQLPQLDWIDVSAASMQKIMAGLWEQAGYMPPMRGESGIANLEVLKEKVLEDEAIYAPLVEDLNAVIAGHLPKKYEKARLNYS